MNSKESCKISNVTKILEADIEKENSKLWGDILLEAICPLCGYEEQHKFEFYGEERRPLEASCGECGEDYSIRFPQI